MSLRLVARSIFANPGNRGQYARRVARAVGWQAWKRSIRRPRTIRLANGVLFRAHPDCVVSSALHYAAWPEFAELHWLRPRLEPGDVVLDVGANVGHMSLLLADRVGQSGLIAFEPAPVAFSRLAENWRLNGWDTSQLFEVAVGRRPGRVAITSTTTPLTTVSVLAVQDAGREVEMVCLDDLRDRWRGRTIGLLKIDVEGYEVEVLEGARAVLREDCPETVMFESLSGTLDNRISALLSDAGYQVFQLDEEGRPRFDEVTAQNLFAVRTVRADSLRTAGAGGR